MKTHRALPYRDGAEIINGPYEKEGQTKCPIKNASVKEKRYVATMVKGKWIDVEEFVLRVKWIE